jgi:glycosyltransferase involved in cell wall biosynthesis
MRISVAICTYNGARFLEEQLRSILDGRRMPDQIVLSDDGSSDGTLALARRVLEGAPTDLIVLENDDEPRGVTANFERAIRATAGDVVVLCDQDDVWPPERLARIESDLAASDALVRHSDARLVDAGGVPLGRTLFQDLRVSRAEWRDLRRGRAFEVYLRRNLATGATTAVRRELIDQALPFPEAWVHDEWVAVIAAARGRISVVRGAEIDYRQHSANQIGVARPTLRYRLRRITAETGARNETLARRAELLADRLESLGLHAEAVEARAKARFETRRAALPARRVARIPAVLRGVLARDYRRWASQRSLDALRDVLRPA